MRVKRKRKVEEPLGPFRPDRAVLYATGVVRELECGQCLNGSKTVEIEVARRLKPEPSRPLLTITGNSLQQAARERSRKKTGRAVVVDDPRFKVAALEAQTAGADCGLSRNDQIERTKPKG